MAQPSQDQLRASLLEAYVELEESTAKARAARRKIAAIRNVLAGVALVSQPEED
tara:strand:- start:13268 stop:13429 length:162 start_codon:yes stop_codon:yes gene_type:complete